MNKQIRTVLRNACRAAPAALAFGIVPTALAETGDLDPGFADVGRLVLPDFLGSAFTVDAQDDNIILAGGKLVPQFGDSREAFGFARRLSGTAALDATFAAAGLDDLMVVDLEVQPDGTMVGVGRRTSERDAMPVAFRLERDGSLDADFGLDGVVELTNTRDVHSVAVDPGGTIVIAATLFGETPRAILMVLRLLSTGELDDSFGTAGVFSISAGVEEFYVPSRILSAENGGYRIAVNQETLDFAGCRVLALTASGTFDWFANVDAGSACNSMAELPDGRLLIAGSSIAGPLVVRLLANGDADPTFAAELPADTALDEATDIAVDANTGSIVVVLDDVSSSSQEPGLVVSRMQADGAIDQLFGDGGSTWVDLPEVDGNATFANPGDVTVLDNSDVLVSGGAGTAFVARLVGGSGNDSPGVLGVGTIRVETTEEAQEAVVTVRRMGGKTGSVSAAYETHATPGDFDYAIEGQDFTAVSGRLDWADGDAEDKQIVVPIAPDDGSPEETEQFAVKLSDVQGGAGTGTRETTVFIESDAPPAGMFAIYQSEIYVGEKGYAQVTIHRNYHYAGAVSVTVTPSSGTAILGEDFKGEPVTLTWADGSYHSEFVSIRISKDTSDEPQEQFTLRLSDATGGAVIGPRSTVTIFIADNDEPAPPPPPPPPPPDGGGGGGPVGFVSLLLLGVARLIARWSGPVLLASSPRPAAGSPT